MAHDIGFYTTKKKFNTDKAALKAFEVFDEEIIETIGVSYGMKGYFDFNCHELNAGVSGINGEKQYSLDDLKKLDRDKMSDEHKGYYDKMLTASEKGYHVFVHAS